MKILEIANARKFYGGVEALSGCSVAFEKNRITALIGPNGAGKTTLFNAINGFVELDSGAVIFNGQNVTREPAWRRSRLGMSRTFQTSRVFANLTLRDNLLLAAREDDDRFWQMTLGKNDDAAYEQKINEAMGFVGLKKNPNSPAAALSYGEQKLFGLARALLNPHIMLLLDEPVAGVNPVIRQTLSDLLSRLRDKKESVLLVEHDMDFVRSVADYVVVMDQGEVLAEGLPHEVLRDKKVLRAYLGG